MRITFLLLATLILAVSCSHKITRHGFDKYIPDSDKTIEWQGSPKPELQVLYLGAGHMIIKSGDQGLFTDPFFSNQPLKRMIGKVGSDTTYLNYWCDRITGTIGFDGIHTGLVSHSHYDHLMDLPMMLDEGVFHHLQAVYGNPCMPRMLVNFKGTGPDLNGLSEDEVYSPGKQDTSYRWVRATDQMQFLPISTNHAPQLLWMLTMNGKLDSGYFSEHLKSGLYTIPNKKWTVGNSYAFLVDIGSDGNRIRLYIQTSASRYPNGLPPKEVLEEKDVDLVIFCYASTQNAKKYPGFLLDSMKTASGYPQMLVVHWEDFFTDHQGYTMEPRLVALTNTRRVKRRWGKLGLTPDKVVMPKPGALVTYR